MQLYNKLSSKERAVLIDESNRERITLSFYQYAKILDLHSLRDQLFLKWDSLDVLGRIYLADEGINAQLSIPKDNFSQFKTHLKSVSFLKSTSLNIAVEHNNKSFLKLKVKVRDKIVADGLNDKTFDVTNTGVHLDAVEYNKLADEENSIVVDMRNHYESEIGHFKNAITPDVDTFRGSLDIIEEDLKDHKEDKNLIMYCTGGIRCEKASVFLRNKGFKKVYQLKGGIINYLEKIKKVKSLWKGECYVFDNRISVKHKLKQGTYSICGGCRTPVSILEKKSKKYEAGVSCSNCHDSLTKNQKERFRMRQKQISLAKQLGKKHTFQKEFK